MQYTDLRSDTVTHPTQAMREAMSRAVVGDDVYGDDPTVNELQALGADMLGKEAALFMPTGTMSNQVAVMAQTRPGDEIIIAGGSHIVLNECGGVARFSGVSCAAVFNPDGKVTPEDIHRRRRDPNNIHHPRTTLVCLENALGNGDVYSLDEMKALRAAANEHGLRVHLDGARIFNAATALGVSAHALADCADTVSCCLSKGLCAPVGTLLCGPKDFIAEALRCRKALGGGMRQAGVLAACGILSLTTMTKRLDEDHDNARLLGDLLAAIPGITVYRERLRINMVFWEPKIDGFNNRAFGDFMLGKGFRVTCPAAGPFRLITHNGIMRADVERFAALLTEYVGGLHNV